MSKLNWLTLWLSTAMLFACGGGQTDQSNAGVNSGGTGSYSNGPITGFGSIVVNGIHYDQTLAAIRSANAPDRALTPADLKLGMVVELNGSSIQTAGSQQEADALTITISSALLGPIDAIGNDNTLTVMGQTVRIVSSTQFEETHPRAALLIGDVVEIYGFHDAGSSTFVASRIEVKTAPVTDYVVQGVIQDLDLITNQCRIGNQTLYYAWTPENTPPGLANGRVVRAKLLPAAVTDDNNQPIWMARTMTLNDPTVTETADAQVDGLVTDVTPGTPTLFSVNGVPVDAGQAGCVNCDAVQLGDPVRVRGRVVNAVIQAATVSLVVE